MMWPYWRQLAWSHTEMTPVGGRRVGTISEVPIFLRLGAVLWPAMFLALFLPSLFAGGEWPLFSVAFVVTAVASIVCHESAHAVVARAVGQHVNYGCLGLRAAWICWGQPAEKCSPRQSAFVAAAGPTTNLALCAISVAGYAVTTPGAGHIVFGLSLLFNALGIFNLVPYTVKNPSGQGPRVGTDGHMVLQAFRAARRGPGEINMFPPVLA